jgi:acetolactate synthase regulatory subunit
MQDLKKTATVLVALNDGPHALSRLLALCHRRGWTPVSLRSVSDGARAEVTMRLVVQADRRGVDHQLRTQIGRLVDVEHVTVDDASGLPDAVAFAAVRRKAPWAVAA